MRTAIPLFGRDIAPRFEFSDQFLIAEINNGRIENTMLVQMSGMAWFARLERLHQAGVMLILCGGFNRCFTPLAEQFGLKVWVGLVGDAQAALQRLARGELKEANDRRWMWIQTQKLSNA